MFLGEKMHRGDVCYTKGRLVKCKVIRYKILQREDNCIAYLYTLQQQTNGKIIKEMSDNVIKDSRTEEEQVTDQYFLSVLPCKETNMIHNTFYNAREFIEYFAKLITSEKLKKGAENGITMNIVRGTKKGGEED